MAVTTEESLDGIREKARRIASLDEMEAHSIARRGPSPGRAEIDKQAKEIVRAFVGSRTNEGDIVVACDSKSMLWKDVDLKRAMQKWNMKHVDKVKSPDSALRVITSSERLANPMSINEMGKVGKLVKRIEMYAPRVGKLVKKGEICDAKVGNIGVVGKLVGKIEMSGPQAKKR